MKYIRNFDSQWQFIRLEVVFVKQFIRLGTNGPVYNLSLIKRYWFNRETKQLVLEFISGSIIWIDDPACHWYQEIMNATL